MRFSSDDGTRAVSGSPPSGRPYRSLTGRTALSHVYGHGSRVRSGDLTVLTASGEPGLPQVAVVAGRRVGSSVLRNRAKRRLRAALERVPLQSGTAYVVIAGRSVVDVDFAKLVEWLRSATQRRGPSKEESG